MAQCVEVVGSNFTHTEFCYPPTCYLQNLNDSSVEDFLRNIAHEVHSNHTLDWSKILPFIRYASKRFPNLLVAYPPIDVSWTDTEQEGFLRSLWDKYYMLSIISEIMSCAETFNSPEMDSAFQFWVKIVTDVLLHSNPRRKEIFVMYCVRLLTRNSVLLDRVCDFISSGEVSPSRLVLSSVLALFMKRLSNEKTFELSNRILDNLLKVLFKQKLKFCDPHLSFFTNVIFNCVDADIFRSTVIPVLSRAVLRSAEAHMPALTAILHHVSFQLDFCATDLAKSMVKYLCVSDDSLRRRTINVVVAIVNHCADVDAITGVMKLVHNQLTSAECKASGQGARFAVLTCLGKLTAHGANRQAVCDRVNTTALGLLVEYMEKETHEETLIYSAKQLEKWLTISKTNIPDKFSSFIKSKAFDAKIAPAVRCSYLAAYDSAIAHANIGDKIPATILTNLLGTIQRTVGQPNHSPMMSESVCCSLLWLRHFLAKSSPLTADLVKSHLNTTPIWTQLVGEKTDKRRPWFSERFLQTAPDYVLVELANLLTLTLLGLHAFLPADIQNSLYRTLVLLAVHPHYSTVRRPTLDCIQFFLQKSSDTHRYEHANRLLMAIYDSLCDDEDHITPSSVLSSTDTTVKLNSGQKHQTDSSSETLGPRIWNNLSAGSPESEPPGLVTGRKRCHNVGNYVASVVKTVVCITAQCGGKEVGSDKSRSCPPRDPSFLSHWRCVMDVFVTSVFASSHCTIGPDMGPVWEFLRKRCGLPDCCDQADWMDFVGRDFLQNTWKQLVDRFVNQPCLDQTLERAIERLIIWSPAGFGKQLLSRVICTLDDPRYFNVTKREVEIMLTPESELYNQELLDSLPKYQKSFTNIKRENKLYSYDVQLDIMEAKKQQDERMRLAIQVSGEPSFVSHLCDQLTEKQLESIRNELANESSIRQRLFKLDAEVRHMASILTVALYACPSKHFGLDAPSAWAAGEMITSLSPQLSDLLSRSITNILTAPYVLKAYVNCICLMASCKLPCTYGDMRRLPDTFGTLAGWWSIRVLGPTRLLHLSDLPIYEASALINSCSPRIFRAHRHNLSVFADDALTLTMRWSGEPIKVQTTRVLNILRETFTIFEAYRTLVCSFLSPTFEFIFLVSGWARPLIEDVINSSFTTLRSALLSPSSDEYLQTRTPIPVEIRCRWDWVNGQHVEDLLNIWLRQLDASGNADSETRKVQCDIALRVVPFGILFRLMRQIIERNSTNDRGGTHLLSTRDDDATLDLPSEEDAGCDEELQHTLQASAQLATDAIRCLTNLLSRVLCSVIQSSDIDRFDQIVRHTLQVLLTGAVSESAEAREICLQCVLSLMEQVPILLERINLATVYSTTPKSTIINELTPPSTVDHIDKPELEPGDGDDPATLECEPTADVDKPRKKLTKTQRRKQKQAQLLADLNKCEGELTDKPYETPASWPSLPLLQQLQVRIWVCRSDLSTEVANLAEKLWIVLKMDEQTEHLQSTERKQQHQQSHGVQQLLDAPKSAALMSPMLLARRLLLETTRPGISVQKSTACAFAMCLFRRSPDEVAVGLEQLIKLYRAMLYREPAVKDSVGRILLPESIDRWCERSGLAFALQCLPQALNPAEYAYQSLRKGLFSPDRDERDEAERSGPTTTTSASSEACFDDKSNRADLWLLDMFRFLVPDGLNDRSEVVQSEMLQAGLTAVSIYGKSHIDQLLPILETFLNKAPNVAELDAVRQSVLILTASLSQHLQADDPKVFNIFNKLLTTLNFPSDVVQQAVEDCIASLVSKLSEEQKTKTVSRLMTTLLSASNYAERHGAAHGIAGVARGLGIMSLKHYGIVDKLLPALEDTKSTKRREGALLAIERLCLGMGRLFEPYIIRLISGLLAAFGDSSSSVREAASNTARAIMGKLSAHGVRLILPALLKAIDNEQSWRTKAQSVELLATMTHCAPKQLSACLPQIVPRLLDVLVTSQEQLKQSGVRALKQIGGVIRNPEVKTLVPLLTACLQDPLADKMPCLLALRDTCFVHVLDAPSLALILPVIQRAFADSSTEARKSAAQIFGNLHSLARKEDLQPYVANILPPLKTCLLDAVPAIRSVAAASLGALVRGMGESCFKEILPWLISTLTSDTSSVDRSGAAQGLAEVLGAMGIERLRSILPDLIRTAASDYKIQPYVRDGYLMLFIYLPVVFQDSFAEFIGPIVPTILKSLSDETEFLRETALRAAQRIVQMFAESSLELILPELELGIMNTNWRIRHSSVQLLGDLLYQLSGLSGKGTTNTQDEDDTFGTAEAHERLKSIMGVERHDRVLSRLHMVRSDPTLLVRQAAIHVWKIVVSNTSRTLREIMPVLIRILLSTLGRSNKEQQQVAARALGDVVRKLGERILPEVIPLLVQGLESNEPDQRRGVCTGLMEIMRSCPREQLANYTDSLILPIRRTLCDELPEVRRSGARAFELLYGALGVRSLDYILPDLLAQLDDTDANPHALDALRQLLVVKGKAVMPYLVPKLIHPTVNVKAFAYLASVSGEALSRQLNRILPALLTTVSQPGTEDDLGHCASVLICIYDLPGVRYIINTLITGLAPSSTTTSNQPPVANQLVAGSTAYLIACLRLLAAYLNVSFENFEEADEVDMASQSRTPKSTKDGEGGDDDADEEDETDSGDEDEDETDEDDDEEGSSDEEDDDDDFELDDGDDEEIPDAKDSVNRVLREYYPVALRNICRLLAMNDPQILTGCWKCLEAVFQRWSLETVNTQINDLRQGVRGAVSEFRKFNRSKDADNFLPGFSDPNLPLVSLVKLYADCTLRGLPGIREPAAQALAECIEHSSGTSLKSCVIKVIGPLIRLLGERQTDVVRTSVVQSLTLLITKCPASVRPFVTQLQATFLKCLGDPHRPVRILGGKALASIAPTTPKLDLLLQDLARVPTQTVLSYWPGEQLPVLPKAEVSSAIPGSGSVTTALSSTGIATYPETSLHALRLCVLSSTGRAGLPALNVVLSCLSPMMYLPEHTQAAQMGVVDDDDQASYSDDQDSTGDGTETTTTAFGQVRRVEPIIQTDAIRMVASCCIGCVVGAASSKTANTADDANPALQMLNQFLFPKPVLKAQEHWTFVQSQATILLISLKYSSVIINAQTIRSGMSATVERSIQKFTSHNKLCVQDLGLRCAGLFVGRVLENPNELSYDITSLLNLITQAMKDDSTDVRLLVTKICSHIAFRWNLSSEPSLKHRGWLGGFAQCLLTGSRDKTSAVRTGSETALAILCKLGASKESNSLIQLCCDTVDANNRGLLDSQLQRLRKLNWTEIWQQGCPDLDNSPID